MTPESNQNQEENVIADYADEMQQIQMEAYKKTVRRARNALFWAGGLIFFWEMIGMFRSGGFDPVVFGIALVEGGIFVGLALWTKTKPHTAVVFGLAAFIGLIVLSVVVNGILEGSAGVFKGLFSGIIVKIIILVNLILPLSDAKALQEAKSRKF